VLRDETGIVVQESNEVDCAQDSCEHLDVKTSVLLVAVLFGLPLFAVDCPKNQPKNEAALLELEHHWADALTHKDADAVSCILADEFEDADVDGSLHTRAEALARIPQRKPWTNRLTEMRAHVEGNSGFARGLNEILDADGKVVARVRFTDIFTYRDGRWQALAGQETLLGKAHR
jgi:ketosteroid isomerase-like protein